MQTEHRKDGQECKSGAKHMEGKSAKGCREDKKINSGSCMQVGGSIEHNMKAKWTREEVEGTSGGGDWMGG